MDGNTARPPRVAPTATVTRVLPNGPEGIGLTPWEEMDPATLAAGAPVQSGHLNDEAEAEGYLAGVWLCTAFDDAPGPYTVDEYMLLLEGEVIMAMPNGDDVHVKAGEAFVIPKGLDCQWKMPGTVRKVFMILDGRPDKSACNASLARVTKPTMGALPASQNAVETTEVSFINADGRMKVLRRDYGQPVTGHITSAERRLITILEGTLQLNGELYEAGDTAYITPGAVQVSIAAGTRLIEASFSG